MHLGNSDWIRFTEGNQAQAVDTAVSALVRYYYPPKREPFLSLKYNEYFEEYRVAATCPISLQGHFLHFFPGAATPTQVALAVPPTLDEAPAGKQCFV